MASLISNKTDGRDVETDFLECLQSMHSNVQFPMSQVFEQDLPKEKPKQGREQCLVEKAKEAREGIKNVFVDTNSSLHRLTHAAHVCPCITPTHSIYSTALERYLTTQDLMHCQGFWPSCMDPKTYQAMQDNRKKGQDLVGNSFSTTVFQAVFLSSMASAPASWSTIQAKTIPSGQQGPPQGPTLRRVRGKRPAPAYDHANIWSMVQKEKRKEAKKQSAAKAKKRLKYRRKKKGADGRKFSKGKKTEATIWEKEQLTLS